MELPWCVLRNEVGQFGIYPADRTPPGGWLPVDHQGSAEACRRWLEEQAPAHEVRTAQ